MNFEDINFPVYRMYKNGLSYFKVMSPVLFEEVQIIGSRRVVHVTEAKLFPEKTFVHDLVFNYKEMALEITGAQFENAKS